MTKLEHIRYWVDTAEKDWTAAEQLFAAGSYVHGLFFIHLSLEKLCKAHWIKDNPQDIPPRIHNLLSIISRTQYQTDAETLEVFDLVNTFQLEGRYPDYQQRLYQTTTQEFATQLLERAQNIRICLLNLLP